VVAAWLVLIPLVFAQTCLPGWIYSASSNSCYQIFYPVSVTQDQARDYCKSQDPMSDLGSFSSPADQQSIQPMVSRIPSPAGAPWYQNQLLMGATWISNLNQNWEWVGGQPFNAYGGLWCPVQPEMIPFGLLPTGGCSIYLMFQIAGLSAISFGVSDCMVHSPCTFQFENILCQGPPIPTTAAPNTTTALVNKTVSMAKSTTAVVAATTTTAPVIAVSNAAAVGAASVIAGDTTTAAVGAGAETTTAGEAGAETTTAAGGGKAHNDVQTTTASSAGGNNCCPSGGVWNPWKVGKCSKKCGACGTQKLTRTCKSQAYGCKCTGSITHVRPCNLTPCTSKTKPCCSPYKKIVVNNKDVCGPTPSFNATYVAPVCA